jgi:hypothetical protein
MVATYELLARPGRSGRQLASADYAEALAAVGGMVEADGGHDWLVGNRVYMQVRIEADPSDCILQVRFFLQYAMATRLADCRDVALGLCTRWGWELFDPQRGEVVDARPPRPWWRFW